MYNPPGGAVEEEYIELLNLGPADVNLAGWEITDGVDFRFPPMLLGVGEYLAVAASQTSFTAKYPAVSNVVGNWDGRLSNAGEAIVLRNADNIVVDRVEYSDEGEWGLRELGPLDYGHRGWVWRDDHDGGGKSLELIRPPMPNEYGQNWAASLMDGGTPGQANSVLQANLAPMIVDAIRVPVLPTSTQANTLTARILDEAPGAVAVTLHHRVDGMTSFTATPMLDDGLSGDGLAGDGVFGAAMPAQPNGTIIEYYVGAHDATSSRTLPAPSLVDGVPQQVTNFLYLVDDVTPTAQPLYHIIMTEAERAELEDIGLGGGDQNSNAQMNATFISVDEKGIQARYTIGVRNRGHGSRDNPPNNYRVNFRHDRPWNGVSAINLNTDFTYLQLAGNKIFRMAGLESPDVEAVQVRVNGQNLAVTNSEMFGSYVRLEVIDDDFVEKHFPDNSGGNVYKGMRVVRPGANLRYQGPDPDPYRVNYFKQSNETEDDWSDLIDLTYALSDNTTDSIYVSEVHRVADVEEWLRFFAINAILDNAETTLASGNGDDYYLYRGENDTRFVLIQHDLDSIFGLGDSIGDPHAGIFKATAVPALNRLLNHPEFLPRYYWHLFDLLQTVFAPGNLDAWLDAELSGWVPPATIEEMKDFITTRTAHIQTLIPTAFTIATDLPLVNGYPRTTTSLVALHGTAPAAGTRSIMVNGGPAVWSPIDGTWSTGAGGVTVVPGINRVWVRAFDGPDGTGQETAGGYIDIWYDDGMLLTDVTTPLTEDTILTKAGGPYRVAADLIVPVGITLTVEPGAALYFESGTQMIVYGRLLCEGTDADRIRLTCNPNTSSDWEGIVFDGTQEDNRLTWTAMDFADGGLEAILVRNSRLLLDNMTWTDTSQTVLELDNSSVLARNCVFPSVENNETVHGHSIPPGGYLIFDGNVFGRTTGYSDVIDFTNCKRPDPILQVLNNVFVAGSDDGVDLDGADAHVEGNLFMNFAQDAPRASSSNAIATGVSGGVPTDVTIVRNIFINNEHDILLKEGSSATIQNNTFYGARIASINFDETNQNIMPGYGAYIEGCIFRNMAALFQNQFAQAGEPDPIIRVNQSVVPAAFHALGFGNLDVDPLFRAPAFNDFSLAADSPAIDSGPNGLDRGALVPAGASVSGEPPRFTTQRTAILTVAGPGITHYRYSLDGDAYGAETPVSVPIQLSGLADGDHVVHLIGKNSAAVWQPEAEATASRIWTINGVIDTLAVSELMYNPPGGHRYEYLELHNTHPTVSLNLATMTFTEGTTYTFPTGAAILPGSYALVVGASPDGNFADFRAHYGLDESVAILGPYEGGLSRTGETVTLADGLGIEVLSFEYDSDRGWPVAADGAGHSMVPLNTEVQPEGSLDYGGNWRASTRLDGSPGSADPAFVAGVMLNEFMVNTSLADPSYPDHDSNDWIELHNVSASTVSLNNWYLSDDAADLMKWAIPTTATIAAGGFISFDEITGFHNPITEGFGIDQTGERLFLSYLPGTSGDRVVDAVRFKGQESGVSLGRFPDGGSDWYAMSPSRGLPNTTPHERVVISEIMFHPADGSNVNEYVELYNPTSSTVELWNTAGTWRLDGGIEFSFPALAAIPPGGRLLFVNFDPNDNAALTAFKAYYGIAAIGAPVLGPFRRNLSNKGERVAVERPLPPDPPGDWPAWVIVDEAIYFDRAPWTDRADGSGLALHRLAPEISGNDPGNWIAAPPTPGGEFSTQTYTLVISAVNGTVGKWPDCSIYYAGTEVTLTAVPSPGYHFAGWTGDVPGSHESDNPLAIVMDGDRTITALFSQSQFALTTSAVNGSVLRSPDRILYDSGERVSLTAVPESGYHFVAWSGDVPPGEGTSNPLTVTMDRPRTLKANFAAPVFAITWPDAGTAWPVGASGQIRFTAQDLPGPGEVILEIWQGMTKAGSLGRVPCQEGQNTVMKTMPPNVVPGAYQIRLFWAEYTGNNVRSKAFSVVAGPTLVVTSPGNGDVWSPGAWWQIVFTATNVQEPDEAYIELWQGSSRVRGMGTATCRNGTNVVLRQLPADLPEGQYQLRLFLASNTSIHAWSEWFTVGPRSSARQWELYP